MTWPEAAVLIVAIVMVGAVLVRFIDAFTGDDDDEP